VGLDPVQTVELRALVRELRDCTIVLSTHLLTEASQLCDRVVILRDGRLVAEDSPAGLAARVGSGRRVLVRVEGPSSAVEAAVREAAAGARVDTRRGDDGTVVCVVYGADARAVQRHVAAAVVAGGWVLREIREEAPTLEDLFVELVR
jgi:ABC-2 type transport system ATP-binding protein